MPRSHAAPQSSDSTWSLHSKPLETLLCMSLANTGVPLTRGHLIWGCHAISVRSCSRAAESSFLSSFKSCSEERLQKMMFNARISDYMTQRSQQCQNAMRVCKPCIITFKGTPKGLAERVPIYSKTAQKCWYIAVPAASIPIYQAWHHLTKFQPTR